MKRLLALLLAMLCLAGMVSLHAQDSLYDSSDHCTMTFQGLQREYYVFVPDSLSASRPLVFMLHGYGGHAKGYREEMLRTACRHGFALCIPQGFSVEGKCKPGWNVGYPVQKVMKTDDVAFMLALRDKVLEDYKLNAKNCFFCGMSNGGEMCYIMAYRHPSKWAAIASVAGLRMQWLAKEKCRGHVPFMEIHGTADKTSNWKGDYTNKGGWGAYSAVPQAVRAIADANGCVYDLSYVLHLKDPSKPSRQVILHKWSGPEAAGDNAKSSADPAEVRLYEVVGGKHSWHLADLDTTEEIWTFFQQYLQ